MGTFWFGIVTGGAAVAAIELVIIFTRRGLISNVSPESVKEQMSTSSTERNKYALWGLSFPFSIVPAIWFAVDSSRTSRQVEGVMFALMAGMWLALGSVPYFWVGRGGRGNVVRFRSKLEHYSRSKFRHLVALWVAAIALMTVAALNHLLF